MNLQAGFNADWMHSGRISNEYAPFANSLYLANPIVQLVLMPYALQLNGAQGDDAIKNYSWYQKEKPPIKV